MPFAVPAELPTTVVAFEERHRMQVLHLWRRNFRGGSPDTFNRDIDSTLASGAELFRIAVCNGAVVGTCLGASDGHRSWIYYLCVDKRMRRKGIGTALLDEVEGRLRARGTTQIGLHVRIRSHGAINFYRSRGYFLEETQCMGKRML